MQTERSEKGPDPYCKKHGEKAGGSRVGTDNEILGKEFREIGAALA
jgi:hypothetical protein